MKSAACPNCGATVVEGRCSSVTCQNHNGIVALATLARRVGCRPGKESDCPVHGQSATNVGWLRLFGRRVYYHTFIGWRLWLLEHRSTLCVCDEINTLHCPVHGQGETTATRKQRQL